MITVKITSGNKNIIQGRGEWAYAWVNNAGETAIYATTVASDKTVSELIADYEAGGAKDIVKLPAGSSKRLRANNRPVIIFGAEAGIAEVDLTNVETSPFKVQAKGGDDGSIEPISITDNGTYTASGKTKGYSPVTVSVQPDLGIKTVSANGTYSAEDDDLDGYSSVTVAVLPNVDTKTVTANGTYTASDDELDGYSSVNVNVDFYPKAHATLDDATRVEGDDMRVYPIGGTNYYPYVYLGARPYGTTEEFVPCGKYFTGQTQEYTVTVWMALIDVATGEVVSGYPQQIAPTQAGFSIVDGGYCRIKNWEMNDSASQVRVTIERYNPTYTKPVENTYGSSTVQPSGALDGYLTAPFKVVTGVVNRITYVGAKHPTYYGYTGEKISDIVGMRLYSGSSAAGQQGFYPPYPYVIMATLTPIYWLIIGAEQLPANSSGDVYMAYDPNQSQQMTISEMLINNMEQYGGQYIFALDGVSEFAFIYSYPPTSQG